MDRRTDRRWVVVVDPFEIAATPVSVQEWNSASEIQLEADASDLPAVQVTWRDAIEFCNERSRQAGLTPAYSFQVNPTPEVARPRAWAPQHRPAPDDWHVEWDQQADGYRLPTEAEWQVACRADSAGPRYGDLDEIGWYEANSGGRLRPVGQKQPNAWGLFDMLGGVWEWCWDLYDPDVYGPYRVIRGGGWADPRWSCRVGVRRKTSPGAALDDLGLRLVRTTDSAGRFVT
ncbi:formylglycine-generating enzyme family protein [Nocardioides sp.]|uniref:formylglycine-generating enzyme family protein n=1 Tax=Nocardioides sp. TaxID=35761 RepID=UPI002ED776F4